MIALNEAVDMVLAAVRPLTTVDVGLGEAFGRVLASDLVSPEEVPSFDNSAMDGFAVRAADEAAGAEGLPIVAEIPAGRPAAAPLRPGEAMRIMTGAPLPAGADAVAPVENTEERDGRVTVRIWPAEGANVRRAGEDVRAGSPLLPAGVALGPAEVGLLASVGVQRVPVVRRPRVALVATGSELVALGEPLGAGQIRNSNSYTACGQVLAAGCEPVLLGIARDDPGETRDLIARALEEDVVVTSGGVSVGDFDFVKAVLDGLGVERRFWKVRTKPGKPVVFGVHGDTLVFGAPGNPVAAMVTFELYVRPALLALQGRRDIWRPYVVATAGEPVAPTKDRVEVRRCRLTNEAGEWRFATTGPQGSGILRSMALADGLLLLPSAYGGGAPGARHTVLLLGGARPERPPYPD